MCRRAIFLTLVMSLISTSEANTTGAGQDADVKLSASAGLGYDSNAYQAPRGSYVDYAAVPVGSNPTVLPERKSGFFVPYEFSLSSEANLNPDTTLSGSLTADGSFYSGAGLGNANEYNFRVRGGSELVLARNGKSANTFYVGALAGKHKQIYVDHDSGVNKVSTLSGADISNRYSYISVGVEARYKHRTGDIDYGVGGQYLKNDYANPVAVSQLDHAYSKLSVDVGIPVAAKTNLNLSFDHTERDYSSRHTHDALGVYKSTYPLLHYKYNAFGATLRGKAASEWVWYLDYDRTDRSGSYVGYNDYTENRYGLRVLYGGGAFKSRLSLHHWGREYPNGFAYDVAGRGKKSYSGNVMKFRSEFALSDNASLWAELQRKDQTSTDLRYDYLRSQIMFGARWAD
jgi:hypothetical protein